MCRLGIVHSNAKAEGSCVQKNLPSKKIKRKERKEEREEGRKGRREGGKKGTECAKQRCTAQWELRSNTDVINQQR
jgi:hypothetical protein